MVVYLPVFFNTTLDAYVIGLAVGSVLAVLYFLCKLSLTFKYGNQKKWNRLREQGRPSTLEATPMVARMRSYIAVLSTASELQKLQANSKNTKRRSQLLNNVTDEIISVLLREDSLEEFCRNWSSHVEALKQAISLLTTSPMVNEPIEVVAAVKRIEERSKRLPN